MGGGFHRNRLLLLRGFKFNRRSVQRLLRGGHGIAGFHRFPFGAGQGFAAVFQHPVGRLVTGRQTRHIFGAFGQIRLAVLQHRCRLVRSICGGFQLLGMALARLEQFPRFPFQPLDHFARVTVQPRLAFNIAGQLHDPVAQRFNRLHGAGFLIRQGIALHLKPLQYGGGNRFFLAQRRQGIVQFDPQRLGLAGGGFRSRRSRNPFTQFRLGHQSRLVSLAPAAVQQHPFGAAQFFANRPIPRGLPGLTLQLRQLPGQLFDHIIDPRQILLGAFQLQFGLVPPLIQAGNPGGFFQNAAAVFRLGVDQFGNLPLPHQRRGMRPGRGIGEQHLHVTRPHVLGVDLIGTANVTSDPPHDFKLIVIVEPCRGQAVGIVDDQRHLGIIAGRTGRGTGKNHVLHPATAHGGGAVFAHHPAQRFQQVRLATAIRPHDPGQPLFDQKVRRVHEAFEAGQSEFREIQRRSDPVIPSWT